MEETSDRCGYSMVHVDDCGETVIEVDHHDPSKRGESRNLHGNLISALVADPWGEISRHRDVQIPDRDRRALRRKPNAAQVPVGSEEGNAIVEKERRRSERKFKAGDSGTAGDRTREFVDHFTRPAVAEEEADAVGTARTSLVRSSVGKNEVFLRTRQDRDRARAGKRALVLNLEGPSFQLSGSQLRAKYERKYKSRWNSIHTVVGIHQFVTDEQQSPRLQQVLSGVSECFNTPLGEYAMLDNLLSFRRTRTMRPRQDSRPFVKILSQFVQKDHVP